MKMGLGTSFEVLQNALASQVCLEASVNWLCNMYMKAESLLLQLLRAVSAYLGLISQCSTWS